MLRDGVQVPVDKGAVGRDADVDIVLPHEADEVADPAVGQWLAASDLAAQQLICRDIQALSFEEIPYFPIGQYKQPTAYRTSVTGILDGTAVFWNVRPA